MPSTGPFTFQFLENFGVPLHRIAAGERLFSTGENGDAMYIVLEGKIDVKVGDRIVETVGLHGLIGEMALIDASPRSASAIAATKGEVAVVDRAAFLDLVREEPSFALYVMGVLAGRVRRMNRD